MKYTVRWPDGSADDCSLDQIRKEYQSGEITDDCIVRRTDEKQWLSVVELFTVPSDSAQCFVVLANQRQGPYLPEQIRTMWRSGAINADAMLVWDGATVPVLVTVLMHNPIFVPDQPTALNVTPSHLVTILAVGIVVAFFMPWFQLFGAGISGFEITNLGSYTNYLWVIPGLAGYTVLLGASGTNNRVMGAITGIVPLATIAYGYFYIQSQGVKPQRGNMNIDLSSIAINTMAIGLFLTIGFCALIIFCGVQPKKTK